MADDDLSIVVHVAALGSSFVTVSNSGITNIIQVIVENPIATTLYIDAAHAKALPKVAKYLYIDAAAARMVLTLYANTDDWPIKFNDCIILVHCFPPRDENKKLKELGENRILKSFPDDPAILWEEWKQRPDVFVK